MSLWARIRRGGAWTGVAVSLGMSTWFLWSVDWAELGAALASVHLGAVALASALLLVEFWLRALRWKVLLRPAMPGARVRDLLAATLIGAAANTLLPARAGEVARPLAGARLTGARLSTLVATNVMERVFDVFGLVSVLAAMSLVLPETLGTSRPEDAVLVRNLSLYGGTFGLVALAGMCGVVVLELRSSPLRRWIRRLLERAPGPTRERLLSTWDGFVDGLAAARGARGPATATLLSLGIWFNGVAALAVLMRGFGLRLPLGAACFTAVAIALTVALPQAPGYFGVFHVAIFKTLVLWNVDPAPARAFAIVFWAVSFVPVTAAGLGVLWREGLRLGEIRGRFREAPAAGSRAPDRPSAP